MNLGPDRHAESAMSLVDVLQRRAQAQPDEVVYTFLLNGGTEEAQLSYAELDRRARAVAVQLQQVAPAGARALLLYPPGLDYLIAFYGCLYAGVIAVPAYPPNPARLNRSLSRLRTIVQSARPAVALTTALIQMAGEQLVADDPDFRSIRWLATDTNTPAAADLWQAPDIRSETLAFLQYTSGSTSEPKGVMLTHANLLHNSLLIQHCFGHTRHSRGVIWLPPYHDMGLIGGIIQPLYVGFPVTLLSPVDFLQRPLLWLQTISRTRATTSGGPNFAYDLCVRKIGPADRASLDLSSWDLAFNGAEPIRAETLERFAAAFGPSGFRREAFYPCYGLAEATLIVTGTVKGQPPLEAGFDSAGLEQHRAMPDSGPAARVLVGSGLPQPDHPLLIVHPERQTRCGPGEVGEIWVAGPSIAQGYWERPAQSAHAFQARLADDNSGPFLRTGDLGFLRDGQLFVTGRLKDLLIIRGRNYYPQDIELTVERSHPALRPGCTAAFTVEVEGEERLVVVQELDRQHRKQPLDAVLAAVRQAVADQHELHLHAVVLLGHGSIPKTSSGKIQRHACKAAFLADRLEVVGQQVSAAATADDDLPSLGRTDLLEAPAAERAQLLERFVRQQVARTLGLQTALIKPGQSLTGLGLDSLMSVDLQHALERELGAPVALADLLDGPDVAELAARLLPLLDDAGSAPAEEPSTDEQADVPLTYGQRALWLLHQMAPERGAYHLSNALRLRLPLDPQALLRSFQRLVDRHPALRTRFPLVDVQPVQRVLPADRVAFAAEDASGWDDDRLERHLLALAYRPFDLERDPLLRVSLLSRAADDHVLLVTVHHLITDFWSLALLARELPALYAAELSGAPAELPAPQSDYRAYARWQRELLAGAASERLWRYWQRQLAGPLPVLNLPTDRPRPAVQRFGGASLLQTLDPELSRRAHALAEAHGATLYTLLLAAFGALLGRYSGQDDLLIGTVTAGRSRAAHAGVAGYFVNPLVLRLRPAQQLRFSDLLRQARQTALEGFAHQDYPFPLLVERLQPERDPSRSPLFQVMLMFQQPPHHSPAGLGALAVGAPDVRVSLGGLAADSYALPAQTAQFDLTLLATEHDGRLLLNWNYDTDLFDAATIARMAGHFQTLLAGALAAPETRLADLPLLGEAELRLLRDEHTATAAPGLPDGCLHELVAAQAARTPDAPALRFGSRTLSYRELDRRSNQLAQLLRRRGVGPETAVALCAERTPELVIGLLGILKAG
ncbi:MAG TPA: condensation domain-containing protein, partial [Roseiflexaceae bacterium]|nr:condensation domain-containing protein [Roseiflexaceae bacterium]